MNPVVISTIIGVASFILTIFSAIYLNQRHVDNLMEQMDKRMSKNTAMLQATIDVVRTEVRGLRSESTARFDSLQKQIDRIDQQVSSIFKPVLPPRAGD
ncbi:MAG: hypothetical protein ACREEM_43130 [Blastocatellia bacterium]